MTKTCTGCGGEKALEDFYREKYGLHGRRSRCIACMTNGRPPGPRPVNPLERYEVTPSGCWQWTGAIAKHGYGTVKWEGQSRVAHRVIYELLVGPIPSGLVLDHLCNHKSCVRPEHLEPVTPAVNAQRAWDRRHCATCTCGI